MLARLDAGRSSTGSGSRSGSWRSPRVRELARAAGLSVADKPESQDLCFLAGTRRSTSCIRHAADPVPEEPGEIVDLRGRVLGQPRRAAGFTVGQRRGIGVAAAEPLYVLAQGPALGPRAWSARAGSLRPARWGSRGATLLRPGDAVDRVKLRYRSEPIACSVEGDPAAGSHERLVLSLEEPVDGSRARPDGLPDARPERGRLGHDPRT